MRTLWLVLKNDIKRSFRDKVGWIMMVLFPIIMIFILSSAFGSIMNKNFKMEPFTVGYSIANDSPLSNSLPKIISDLKKEKITLEGMQKDSAIKDVNSGSIAGYVEFSKSGYTFYKNDGTSISAGIFESILKSISYSTGTYTELAKKLNELKLNGDKFNMPPDGKSYAEVKKLDVPAFPSSLDYYGVVMIVNTIAFGIVMGPSLINYDRKRRASLRMSLTPTNPFVFFTAKLVCSFIMSIVQIAVVVVSSRLLLGVTFGPNPLLVIGVLMLFAIAANAFGVMLGYLFSNIGITRMIIFMAAFFFNYFGGSYMQYLYVDDNTLNIMKKFPLYYINRAMVEVTTTGSSSVLSTAILIISVMFLISVPLGALIYSRKEAKVCMQ